MKIFKKLLNEYLVTAPNTPPEATKNNWNNIN